MTILLSILLAAGLALGAGAWGRWRWDRLTRELVARLGAARTRDALPRYTEADLAPLPAPVQRYLRQALAEGVPPIAWAALRHRGSFNTAESGAPAWKPFVSRQWVGTRRPGFVWDGRVAFAPGVKVYVHDAYVAGQGVLHPTLAGVVSLADLRGGGDIAGGELMRWLAEAPLYPTALLPAGGVRWTPVDAQSARATLEDGGSRVSLVFGFGADGLVEWVRADARGRTLGGKVVPTPWEGRWAAYRREAGVLVPTEGEVAWLTPQGRLPYWRGHLEEISLEPAAAAPPAAGS